MTSHAATNDPLFPRSSAGSLIAAALLIGNSVLMLYPIVIMVFSAFKTTPEIFDAPFALPDLAPPAQVTTSAAFLINSFFFSISLFHPASFRFKNFPDNPFH